MLLYYKNSFEIKILLSVILHLVLIYFLMQKVQRYLFMMMKIERYFCYAFIKKEIL